jgi:hypothetical protein
VRVSCGFRFELLLECAEKSNVLAGRVTAVISAVLKPRADAGRRIVTKAVRGSAGTFAVSSS